MRLEKLVDYDQAAGIMTLNVWYRLYWTDHRLAYDGPLWFGDGWVRRTVWMILR